MQTFARKLGRALLVNPALPGLIAIVLLCVLLQRPFVNRFSQPVFGYFVPTAELDPLLRASFFFAVILLVPYPVSKLVSEKFTSKYLRPEEYQRRKIPLALFWGVSIVTILALNLPRNFTRFSRAKAEAMPVANAEVTVLEGVDKALLEPTVTERGGDSIKLSGMKAIYVNGSENHYTPHTVIYRVDLAGSKGAFSIPIWIQWNEGQWRPLRINKGQLGGW